MAEISSAQALPTGHLQSPLFKLIPTEVRLDIYRHTFAGSEVALYLHSDVPKLYNSTRRSVASRASRSTPMPVGGRRSVFCTSGHLDDLKHQLLLTCKQIYDEALAIYWSETIVCNDKGYFSRGLFFERIPDFAKLRIKHLRDVQTGVNPGVKSSRGIAFSRQASLAEALDAFPNLQSCSVRSRGGEESGWGLQPSKAVEEALARHPQVHFLKTYPEKERSRDGFRIRGGERYRIYERTYIDFTTGISDTVDEDTRYVRVPRLEDEEGFQHVMELNLIRAAGGNVEA